MKIQQKYMMKIISKFDKYLISNILKSIQELMDYCKKHYYDKIYVKQIYYNIIEQRRIQYYDLKEILRHFLSLYFLLLPYKKLTFKETIEKIHERGFA